MKITRSVPPRRLDARQVLPLEPEEPVGIVFEDQEVVPLRELDERPAFLKAHGGAARVLEVGDGVEQLRHPALGACGRERVDVESVVVDRDRQHLHTVELRLQQRPVVRGGLHGEQVARAEHAVEEEHEPLQRPVGDEHAVGADTVVGADQLTEGGYPCPVPYDRIRGIGREGCHRRLPDEGNPKGPPGTVRPGRRRWLGSRAQPTNARRLPSPARRPHGNRLPSGARRPVFGGAIFGVRHAEDARASGGDAAPPSRDRPRRDGAAGRTAGALGGGALAPRASGGGYGRCGRFSVRRSSPRSPISTRGTSRRTSPRGAKYGYMLLWVVLASNLMAMLIQSMSAKLGIATGLNLAEACPGALPAGRCRWRCGPGGARRDGDRPGRGDRRGPGHEPAVRHPPVPAALIAGAFSFGILALQTYGGFRRLEAVIVGFVGIIIVGFAVQVVSADPSGSGILSGLTTPKFAGTDSVLLAVGILGATVMPHVIYLHSALTQQRVTPRGDRERLRLFRFERTDVIIAMSIAGVVNLGMIVMAAGVFHSRGLTQIVDIDEVARGLGDIIGTHAEVFFGVALLASGLSATRSGPLPGQVVMQGFIRRRIPIFLRRAITLAPAFDRRGGCERLTRPGPEPGRAVVRDPVRADPAGTDLPRRAVPWATSSTCAGTNALAYVVAALIVGLNLFLLQQTFVG